MFMDCTYDSGRTKSELSINLIARPTYLSGGQSVLRFLDTIFERIDFILVYLTLILRIASDDVDDPVDVDGISGGRAGAESISVGVDGS